MQQDWKDRLGVVFSTNPQFQYDEEQKEGQNTIPSSQQCLYVSIDKKKRAGKMVTLIEGFKGSEETLQELAKTLKQKCGVGGTAKDGEILVQGDFRDKIIAILQASGYKTKRKGG